MITGTFNNTYSTMKVSVGKRWVHTRFFGFIYSHTFVVPLRSSRLIQTCSLSLPPLHEPSLGRSMALPEAKCNYSVSCRSRECFFHPVPHVLFFFRKFISVRRLCCFMGTRLTALLCAWLFSRNSALGACFHVFRGVLVRIETYDLL